MINKLVNILKNTSEVNAWKIAEKKTKSFELFYVLDKLETTRATNVDAIEVTIYVDVEDKRGSSTFSVYSYMNEEDIVNKIKENVIASKFALNPYYEIPEAKEVVIPSSTSNIKDRPLKVVMKDVVDAVFAANTYKNGYLSATEFFLYEDNERIINSKGVDVSTTSYRGNVELIPSWEDESEEVEIYHMMKFGGVDVSSITKEVDEVLLLAKARFEAKTLKLDKEVKVIIQDDEVAQVLRYFVMDFDYSTKYRKSNKLDLGDNVQGENITGDKLNIKLVPSYENAMASKAIDADGVVLKEVEVIKDSIAINRFGSYRFGYYLNESNPTGVLPIMVVKEGSKSVDEMKKEPYIRCVRFSGMQLEPNSGFFGGEVRLGYYFDGEKEIPVTGFSISGNIEELKGSLVLSSDVVTTSRYHGPKFIEIKGMQIV